MSIGATLGTSLSVAIAHPEIWLLALASFLIRGGILVAVVPIVALPSAVGLGNVFAPTITAFVFGSISQQLVLFGIAVVLVALIWLLAGGLFAAVAELECIETVANEGARRRRRTTPAGRSRRAVRILVVRLLAHVPTAIVAVWGATELGSMAYRELTLPSEVVSPIALRVIRDAPEAVAGIVIVWLLGELIGGLAARRIARAGAGVFGGLRGALARIIRRPVRSLIMLVVPIVLLAALAGPWAVGSSLAWEGVRASLDGSDGLATVITLVAFLGLWGGGLVLIALLEAWRGAIWTVDASGTFG